MPLFASLKLVVQDASISLSRERKIVSTSSIISNDIDYTTAHGKSNIQIQILPLLVLIAFSVGLQFSNFVYYCMSQGILDPKTLEMIQNR